MLSCRDVLPKLPLDLTAKYAVCQISLGHSVEAQRHVQDLMEQDVDTYVDLYYDVADAYIHAELHQQALSLYQEVTECDVWE